MKKSIRKKRSSTIAKKAAAVDYKLSLSDYHVHHDHHLCNIVALRNMKTAAVLAKDAQYICFICGRAAKDKKNLCAPVEI